jgi:WD40 repeat protein
VSEDEGQATENVKIRELVSKNISCSSMCLTVDWDQVDASLSSNIAVGLSDGLVSVVSLREAQMQIEHSWKAHMFEVWTVTYDSHRSDILYSGADDCNFCGWDLRESSYQPIFRNTKSHQMGICSIQKCPDRENCIITGSYDECLRLWDTRLMDKPVLKESVGLGGGVWKLKFHPSNGNLVLAACMHNGFAIVRLEDDGIKIVEEYKRHDSLAYGADWFKGDISKIERCWLDVPEISCIENRLDQEEHFLDGRDSSKYSGQQKDNNIVTDQQIDAGNSFDNGSSGKRIFVERAYEKTCSLVATCSFYDKALHIWKPKTPVYDANLNSVDD